MNRQILNNLKKTLQSRCYCCYKEVRRPDFSKKAGKKSPAAQKSDRLLKSISMQQQLKTKILTTGPLTVADYMKEVLTNPICGYYMNKDVFGVGGDFITSPEIVQIFGELVTVWCINEWQKIGSPKPLQIIELGPGRGTLSRDVLRVLAQFKLNKDLSLHLVEISPFLSKEQARNICYEHSEVHDNDSPYYMKGETLSGVKVYWYYRIEDVPNQFSILLAHEFFDALPIHKLQKDQGVWKEVLVDVDENGSNKFRFVLSKAQTPVSKIFQPMDDEKRDSLEISFQTVGIISHLVRRFEEYGGFGLIMDYGHMGEKIDTFRGFRKHKVHDPLEDPGSADLTADVDFKLLKYHAERGRKLITFGPIEQGLFLKNMEGEARLKVLLENCLPENQYPIKSGYQMLTSPEQMGERFKFFSMFPAVLKEHLSKFPVAGFK